MCMFIQCCMTNKVSTIEPPYGTFENKDYAAERLQETRRKRLERVHLAFRVVDMNKVYYFICVRL